MWSCMSNFGGHPWGIGTFIFLGILCVLVAAIVIAVVCRPDNRNHIKDRYDSMEILKVRLARGDISIEEFERLRTYL